MADKVIIVRFIVAACTGTCAGCSVVDVLRYFSFVWFVVCYSVRKNAKAMPARPRLSLVSTALATPCPICRVQQNRARRRVIGLKTIRFIGSFLRIYLGCTSYNKKIW